MTSKILIGLLVLVMVATVCAASEVELSVDDVIIYPQSVALVHESGQEGSGTQFMAKLNDNAYTDSIRVSGAAEVSISTPSYTYSIREIKKPIVQLLNQLKGQSITIDDFKGTLKWMSNSWIGISGDSGFFALPISEINSIESIVALAEPNETKEASDDINLTWVSNGGRNVDVSYLSNGLSWTPVYFLDAGDSTSRMEFWAKITNNFEDLDSEIKLIGGEISINGGGRYYANYATATQKTYDMEGAYAPESGYFDSSPSISTTGEYEVYSLGKKYIKEGESRLISIFGGGVTPEKEYVWHTSSGDKVQRIYIIKNPGKTWPYGTVKVYENGMLMGEDTISWTPQGRKAKVTIGNAPDIEVSKKTTAIDTGIRYQERYTSTLKLKNYKSDTVTVRLIDNYPSYMLENSFKTSDEFVIKPGNLMELNVTLGAGEQKEIEYSYITD